MKHIFNNTLLATTITLLFLTTTTTTATQDDNTVYDTYFEPVKPGQNYYIVPTNYDPVGGGFTHTPVGSLSCPGTFIVTQLANNLDFGEAINFTPQNRRQREIRLSSNINIFYPKFPPNYVLCRKYFSSVWALAPYGSNYVVTTDGALGTSWFTIEDHEEGNYKISFCQNNVCGSLGLVQDVKGKTALGFNTTGAPLSFVFEPNPSPFLLSQSVKAD